MDISKLFLNKFPILLISLFINQKVLTQTLPGCNSPLDLNGQIDGSNVSLVWSPPSESNWISHSNYDFSTSIGGDDGEWMVAHRFTPDQLTEFADYSLTHVMIFLPVEEPSEYQIMVWSAEENGEPSLIDTTERFHSDSLITGDYNFIELDQSIAINDEYELWIGYKFTISADNITWPGAVDTGPAINGYGNKVYFSDLDDWFNLSDLNLDYNWIIAGLISNDQGSRLITSFPDHYKKIGCQVEILDP